METDEQLVRRMAARDESALLELHNRYAHLLVAFLERMLDDPDEVMQSALDTFANAWQHAEAFEPDKISARAWLVTMGHRTALNRRRGTALEPTPLQNWNVPARQPNQVADSKGVSNEARGYLELAFYRGLSQRQVAEETGTPLDTVQVEMRRALRLRADRTEGEA